MEKLLYIESSPRKAISHLIKIAGVFLSTYKAHHPGAVLDTLNLWEETLPAVNRATAAAKYAVMNGVPHRNAQAAAWDKIKTVFNRFEAADKVLFSVPMWSFSIPYVLKHYIDIITQPELAFRYSPATGYSGLVTGKPAIVVYSSAGDYRDGNGAQALDYQKPYLENWLRFIGFTDIHAITVAPTHGKCEIVLRAIETATRQAVDLARGI
ncbi:MAG: NAD(P)H-dependent oxidoreductase [Deltaproteobacteria bacterium]|nr:NAD(P)H-dependent oxidoreductase [Deltaproteobacteria bacterium]